MNNNVLKQLTLTSATQFVLAILLLICLFRMPYGYYQFVRFAAAVGFAFLADKAFSNHKSDLGVLFVALVVLFQPFFKIALGRFMWNVVDVAVAFLLFFLIFRQRPQE